MSRGTPRVSVRCPPELWTEASAVAKANGDTLTDVVQTALRTYVKQGVRTREAGVKTAARRVSDLHGWDPGPNGRCLHKTNGIVCNMPKRHGSHQ